MQEIKEACYKGTRILLGDKKRDIINKKKYLYPEFKNRQDMILSIKRTGIELQYGFGNLPVSYSLHNDNDIEISNNLLKFLSTIKRSEWMY